MQSTRPTIVTADDTTGALETAAACATDGRPCLVVPHGAAVPGAPGGLVVLDLRSRHLPPDEAASRLRSVVETTPDLRAHKVDSTLRGNWPAEVEAIAHAGRTVLMVPAFPAAGRTCAGGVVHVDGIPVHETAFAADQRSPVTTSRPTDRLPGAISAHDLGTVRAALAEGVRIVVADAASDADLDALAALAADHPDVVLVGPAAAITSLVAPAQERPVPAPLRPRVLVVSASRHPTALVQLTELAALGVTVVRPAADARIDDADGVLSRLADDVHRHLSADASIATLVVVGGDTAAAVIGDAIVTVEGSLGVGVAVGRIDLPGRHTLRLVTKPGGFGAPGTLVDVLHDALAPT
jgi:4-hydroxythreonine-4-phosphate dehydrogenase